MSKLAIYSRPPFSTRETAYTCEYQSYEQPFDILRVFWSVKAQQWIMDVRSKASGKTYKNVACERFNTKREHFCRLMIDV